MQPLLLFLYRWLFVVSKRRQSAKTPPSESSYSKKLHLSGFTLLELLISLVIASIVIASLLFLVVQLTTMDKREANLDQVQRDMNRAMDYIANDLQEAVYVYANPQHIANQLTNDPGFPSGAGALPVLAFWRIDPIENGIPTCVSPPMSAPVLLECQSLSIRQAAYTLVVYVQKANDGNANWPGQSRIIRYELSKYQTPLTASLTVRAGYRDPTDTNQPTAQMETWQVNGVPGGSSSVLIDYVQAPRFTPPVALNRAPLNHTGGACRGYGLDANNNPLYTVSPSTATTTVDNTFFACVRNPVLNPNTVTRGSQDVYVFLRGNVQGVSGGVRGYSEATSLPILETQVLVKGVINKGFSQ